MRDIRSLMRKKYKQVLKTMMARCGYSVDIAAGHSVGGLHSVGLHKINQSLEKKSHRRRRRLVLFQGSSDLAHQASKASHFAQETASSAASTLRI